MLMPPPRSPPPDTRFPYTTLFRSIVGASKIARDITDRHEVQQQQILLREMNQRIKNLLTLSSGLVSLSARYAKTPEELATAVQERLSALAQAQELVLPIRSEEHTSELQSLMRSSSAVFCLKKKN